LLLRDDIPTNRAAFPNKVDEYWSAGLPVVTTAGLQAVANIVETRPEAGIVVSHPKYTLSAEQVAWFKDLSSAAVGDRYRRFRQLQYVRRQISFEGTLRPFVSWLRTRTNGAVLGSPEAGLIE
jgi:hypothetical protein